jgi:molecular chaperone DnaK (HSP70)
MMIAIDFGTSNSSVAVFSEEDAAPRLQKMEFGDPESYDPNVMPSAVCSCLNSGCERANTYGHEAIRHHVELQHDSKLLHEMKLYFDKSTQDPPTFAETKKITALREEGGFLTPVSKTYKYLRYEGDVPLKPNEFVPGTATLIRELIYRSTTVAQDKKEIAIGIPASFRELGPSRLREAAWRGAFGQGTRYEGVYLYPEPVAAARSYMRIEKGNILVLDYGGGTLDITVMRIDQPGVLPAKIDFSGFPEAGSRMDQAILHYCLSLSGGEVQDWYNSQPIRIKLKFKRNAEKAKIALSTKAEAHIELPGSHFDPIRLTTGDLSIALQPIMTRMVAKVTETVVKAVGAIENVEFVVLSGGTSLNRAVQIAIEAMFQHIPRDRFVVPDPSKPEDVETCLCAVVRGLAWLRRDGYPPIPLPIPEEITNS